MVQFQDLAARLKMDYQKYLEKVKFIFSGDLSKRNKIYATLSLGWIIFVGYLTWWNGLKSPMLDKSFRWDEWLWFGIVPALAPYLFLYIWKPNIIRNIFKNEKTDN